MRDFNLFINFLLVLNTKLKFVVSDNNLMLAENLFVNLYSDPFLEGGEFSEISKEYVDDKVETFLNLMEKKGGAKHFLQKRSVNSPNDQQGKDIYMLEGFKLLHVLQNRSYVDAVLFSDNNISYIASLEENEYGNIKLGLYKYKKGSFQQIFEASTVFAQKVLAIANNNGVFIIVVERLKLHLYQINEEMVRRIQTLDVSLVTDIFLWSNKYGFFMAVARNTTNSGRSHIYKWFGKHFDLVDTIESFGAISIKAFTIGSSEFIAVANSEDKYGQKEIFSAIFKYNVNTEKFEMNQKIVTNGAKSLAFSSFFHNGIKENILYVINSNKDGNTFHTCLVYKFIDNYFMPYEGLTLDHPEEIIIIQAPGQQQLLGILSQTEGLKIYFYNGWIFTEVNTIVEINSFVSGATSLKASKLLNKDVILILKNNEVNIVEVIFTKEDLSKSVENNLMNWCQSNLQDLQFGSYNTSEEGVKIEAPDVARNNETESTRSVEEWINSEFRGDIDREIETLKIMDVELRNELQTLKEIDLEIPNFFTSTSEEFVMNEGVFVDELIINGITTIQELNTNNINSILIHSILKNKIDIESLNEVDKLQFEDVLINKNPKLLNGNSIDTLLNIETIINKGNFSVKGNVKVQNNAVISGYLNDVMISESNIFVSGINQSFRNDFQVNNLKANNVMVVADIDNKICNREEAIEIKRLENLNVRSLTISKNINNVHIPIITEPSLKSIGNLTETVTFDTLIANEININGSFSTLLNSVIKISNSTYNFSNRFNFNEIEINELNIIKNINKIGVQDSVLDIVWKDASELQEIVGNKTFKHVNVLTLMGKHENSTKTNLVFIEDQVVANNITIEGNVSVKNTLNATNIKSQQFVFGLTDIGKEALKLTDKEIHKSLTLANIVVVNISASYINNIPLSAFISSKDHVHLLTGAKTINSDIYMNGHTKILHLNDVSLPEFEEQVLKNFGKQRLTGKYHINRIEANRLSCVHTMLGNNSWETLSKSTSEISATVNVDLLEMKKSYIHNLKLNKMNNVDFKEALIHAVKNESQLVGNKVVKNIHAKNVYSMNEFNMESIPHIIKAFQTNFNMEDNLQIHKINVENINSKGYINDIEGAKFRKDWIEEALDLEFDEEYLFHNVTILGKTTVQKNSINNLNLDDLFENTVKTDENHKFEDMTFDGLLIVFELITLHGDFIGLDLDSAVIFSSNIQTISGHKTFEKMVTVNGSLKLEQNINDIEMKAICELLSKENSYNLVIKGNAIFTRGPHVDAVNSISLVELANNKWLKNLEANLTGYFKFQNIVFKNNLHVEEMIDNIILENLVSTYFSKSKNQTITGHLDFTVSVNFFNGLKADGMLLDDSISGVRLKDIISRALLNGYTQIYDDIFYADNITVQDLGGEYLLNGMDLQRQVMRYDTENRVLDETKTPNLTIRNLIANDVLLIQNVTILKWLQQAVLRNGGSLQHCSFSNNVNFSKELGVVGYVNGKKFNSQTVLLKSVPQVVNGSLLFNSTNAIAVYFQNLTLISLNGIDLATFIKQSVFNTKDVRIKSPINIKSPISIKNLEIKQSYNGINVTKLLNNLTSFNFENFYENYAKLLNVSKQIQHSLDNYPKDLTHYELIQTLTDVVYSDIFNGYLMAISFANGHYFYLLYEWDTAAKVFTLIQEMNIPEIKNVTFIGRINVGFESYMYIEDAHYGYITKFSENSFEFIQKLILNNTKSLHNFQIIEKNLHCVIFISKRNLLTQKMYCKANEMEIFAPMQTFVMPMSEASSLTMNGETFLITSTQHENENFVTIWQYDKRYERFTDIQYIYVISPCSISTISFKHLHYLAIASGNIEDAIYSGSVQIKWFHPTLQTFVSYQTINVNSPIQVEFAILPSNELVLYVLTESVSESFLVYEHEGIFGFNLKSNMNVKANVIKSVDTNREHLILALSFHHLKVIRGYFKTHMDG